jgi:uroporphyrinogen decarboxylase
MDVLKERAKELIDEGIRQPGYIFNLGHGLFPEASLDTLKELTDYVHEYSAAALKQAAGPLA